jgi:TolA-binding protein
MSTIGDSFVQLNQLEDGLIYFEKSLSKADDNSFIKPIVLLKSGNIALHLKKKSKARNYFQQIKDDFPNSPQADTIDINIAQTQ